jgi:hypothetical protein
MGTGLWTPRRDDDVLVIGRIGDLTSDGIVAMVLILFGEHCGEFVYILHSQRLA